MQLSIAARNARLDAIEAAAGAAAKLQLRTGAVPANCAAAASGTLLANCVLPSDWLAAASGGSKIKTGTWAGTGLAVGDAAHFRITDTAGTTCHLQGNLYQSWAATTITTIGQKRANSGKAYNCTTGGTTAGAGGPTGTGTGITDGTVVWDYIGPADMEIDNASIVTSQGVTIGAFSITDGNA